MFCATQPSCTGPPQIGFVFDRQEAAWDQSYKDMRLVAEGNGGNVSKTDPERGSDPELGRWCENQVYYPRTVPGCL